MTKHTQVDGETTVKITADGEVGGAAESRVPSASLKLYIKPFN